MSETQTHDDWVHKVFGFDVAAQKSGSGKPNKPPPDPAEQFRTKYKPALDLVDQQSHRAIAPGPAADAQRRLQALAASVDAALNKTDVATAAAKLTEAVKEAKTVQAAPDPASLPPQKGANPNEVLFGKNPGETQDVSMDDIHQEGLGDCYLLSSIGEVAKLKPALIKQMIKDKGDGTYEVTLHQEKTGLGWLFGKISGQEYEDVKVTVDGIQDSNVVNSGPNDDKAGGKKEIWLQVIEKAYAKLEGGYDKIADGGVPANAMETLTGQKAEQKRVANVSLADLQDDIAKGKPVVMDTPEPPKGQKLPFGLVGGHAYMLDKLDTDKSGKIFVRLKNPWGTNQPDPIPFDQLGKGIAAIDTGSSL